MWLTRLDGYARSKSRPVRWGYLFFKWNLVAMGAWACIAMCYREITEGRVGLGTGVVVFGFVPAAYRWAVRSMRHRDTC